MKKREVNVQELANFVGGELFYSRSFLVSSPCGLRDIKESGFTYLLDGAVVEQTFAEQLAAVNDFLLLVATEDMVSQYGDQTCVLKVRSPRIAFTKIVNKFFPDYDVKDIESGIHDSVVVSRDAQIHDSVVIGPNSVVGECVLGPNVRVGPNVHIFDGVNIGRASIIYGHCSIGTKDFSPIFEESSGALMHPQIGGVEIGSEVEIYPFSSIARGTFENTVIQDRVKIDHHCHVSHNSLIGEDSILTNGSIICGSVRIGKRCWIGPGGVIREHQELEDDVVVMMGSVVTKSFESGATIGGYPARKTLKIS